VNGRPLTNSDRYRASHRIELWHLRSALIAYRCGSFRRAAELLEIRHSAVSRSVAQLEHHVGITLFERSAAGIRPTQEGRRFLSRATAIIEQVDALVESAGDLARDGSSHLSVGLCTSVSAANLHRILADLGRRSCQIEVTAIERSPTGLYGCLHSGAADIIIVPERLRSMDLQARKLWHEGIFVLLSTDNALASRETIYWADLLDQTILLGMGEQACSLARIIEAQLLVHDIAGRIQRHDVNRHLVYGLASAGLGVSFVLESDTDAVGNNLICRELHDERGQMQVCFHAHWLPGNDNPSLARFLQFLNDRYPSSRIA
jgi:DNA-binding transcriptional LysR family regulator